MKFSRLALLALCSTSLFAQTNFRHTAAPATFAPPSSLSFAPAVAYSAFGGPTVIATTDVNGDGHPDLVVVNACADSSCNADDGLVSVRLGNADGSFQTPVTYTSGGLFAVAVSVADVNGDGKPDLLVVNLCTTDPSCITGTVGVLLGNGDGTFQTAVAYSSGGTDPVAVAVGDINGDGKPDALVLNPCGPTTNCHSGGTVGVLLGNGDGTFQAAQLFNTGGFHAATLALSDLNADGKPDVVIGINYDSTITFGVVSVMLGNGDGTLQTPVLYNSGAQGGGGVAVADLNGDGKQDVVITNGCHPTGSACVNGSVAVLLGNGDGTLKTAVTYLSGGSTTVALALGDIDGDGKIDIVAGSACDNAQPQNCDVAQLGVLLGNGDGTFQTAVLFASGGNGIPSVALADANGDGKLDLFAGDACVSSTSCTTGVVGVLLSASATSPLHLTPPALNFGAHAVGTTSRPRKIAVTNTSSSTVIVTGFVVSGLNPRDYAMTRDCGTQMAAGTSCVISFTFTPKARGKRNAVLDVTTQGAGAPARATLTGTGN
jgi:hypothetical protein